MDKSNNDKEYYLLVNQKFLRNPDLTLDEKALFLILETYANNQDRKAFPSIETLEKLTGHFRKKIVRLIKNLEKKGYLFKQRERGQGGKFGKNYYYLKFNQATKKQRAVQQHNIIKDINQDLSFKGIWNE